MKRAEKREESRDKKHGNVKIIVTGSGKKLSVWVEGIKKILLCLPDAVRILLYGEILSLTGKELFCMTYVGGAVEIRGAINEIRFEPVPSSQ